MGKPQIIWDGKTQIRYTCKHCVASDQDLMWFKKKKCQKSEKHIRMAANLSKKKFKN